MKSMEISFRYNPAPDEKYYTEKIAELTVILKSGEKYHFIDWEFRNTENKQRTKIRTTKHGLSLVNATKPSEENSKNIIKARLNTLTLYVPRFSTYQLRLRQNGALWTSWVTVPNNLLEMRNQDEITTDGTEVKRGNPLWQETKTKRGAVVVNKSTRKTSRLLGRTRDRKTY